MIKRWVYILCILLLPQILFAGTYYVSTTGEASWASAESETPLSGTACTTVALAFTNAEAGDTVYFRAGTYTVPESTGYEYDPYHVAGGGIANDGTADLPITFMAFPDEVPLMVGSHASRDCAIIFSNNGHKYIVFDGFEFEAFYGETRLVPILALYSAGATNAAKEIHCTVKNCTFTGTEVSLQDNHQMIWVNSVGYVTIQNNKFTGLIAASTNTDYHGVAVIESYGAYDDTYANHVTVSNNFFDNCSVCVYAKFGASDFTVYNNWMRDVEAGVVFGPGGTTDGVATQSNHTVYNNVISLKRLTTNTSRILVGIGAESRAENIATAHKYYNNTIYCTDTNDEASGGILGINVTNIENYNNLISLGIYTSTYSGGHVNWRSTNTFDRFDHNLFNHAPFYVHLKAADYTTLNGLEAAAITNDTDNPCSSTSPCDNVASAPTFSNGSSAYSLVSDFALTSESAGYHAGSDGKDIGADVSLVGVGAGETPAASPVSNSGCAPIGCGSTGGG